MPTEDWKALCAARKQRQLAAIPDAWKIAPPPDDVRDVRDVPLACGLLTPREVEITEASADLTALLAKLHSGEWSSVEVTTAFYKRAIIAQQLVRPSPMRACELSSRSLCSPDRRRTA